jgi:hypothetical protein
VIGTDSDRRIVMVGLLVRSGRVLGVAGVAAVAVAIGGAVQAGPAAAASGWEVAQLAPLHDGDITTVYDINENGVAVGESGSFEDGFVPVLWEADGDVAALPLPSGYIAGVAIALNDQSQVVGAVFDEDSERAVVWSGGNATLLGPTDVLVGIGAAGVMLGFDVADLDPDEGCCTTAFVQAVGGQARFVLPAAGALVLPAALTNNGVVVGTAVFGDTPVGIGWYQQYVFPIGGTGAGWLQPIDVIGAPLVLVAREDSAGVSSALVTRTGQVIPLASPSPIDLAADLNDHGVAVGSGGTSFDEPPEVGRLYAYGSAIALDSLVDPEDHAGFDLDFPIALNNAFSIVGNSADGSSWLLRPATGATARSAQSVSEPDTRRADRVDQGSRGERDLPFEPAFAWSTAPTR